MQDQTTSSIQWIGWGAGAIVLYLVVSNTLYLLVGARLLQFLPGVNVKGFQGTIRLALLLVITIIVTAYWMLKWPIAQLTQREPMSWRDEIAIRIRVVARISGKLKSVSARRVRPR